MSVEQKLESAFNPFENIDTAVWIGDLTPVLQCLSRFLDEPSRVGKIARDDDGMEDVLSSQPAIARDAFSNARIEWINEKAVRLFGAKNKQQLVDAIPLLAQQVSEAGLIEFLCSVWRRETTYAKDISLETLDKREICVRLKVKMTWDGEDCHCTSSCTDVSDLQLTRKKLTNVQTRYEHALRGASLGVWDWNLSSNVFYFDPEYRRLLGYQNDDSKISLNVILRSIHREDLRKSVRHAKRLAAGEEDAYEVEHRIRRKDGSYFWASTRGKVCEWQADGIPLRITGTVSDISTERRNREILKIEKLIFQSSASGIASKDILPAVVRLLEKIWPNLKIAIHLLDDSQEAFAECFAPSLPSGYTDLAIGFPVESVFSSCREAIQSGLFHLTSDIREDERFEELAKLLAQFNLVGCASMPISLSNRSCAGTICMYSDKPLKVPSGYWAGIERLGLAIGLVLEREHHQYQQELVNTQTQNRQKFESLGHLAGGIAHDFNNLLLSIISNAELIRMKKSDSEIVETRSNEITKASMIAANLCEQMLIYAGKVESKKTKIDLVEVVQPIVDLVRSAAAGKAKIVVRGTEEATIIRGAPATLSQVIMNLLTNSLESIIEKNSVAAKGGLGAKREPGLITVRTGTCELKDNEISEMVFGVDLRPGKYAFLEVYDNGTGIEQVILKQIFDPFYSTKSRGSGLGLATVVGIIEQHRGAIKVDSSIGVGTRFKIFFRPVSDAVPAIEHSDAAPIANLAKTILVVDDQELVREVIRSSLESGGAKVVVAADGKLAMEAIESHEVGGFDCVLLDQKMPGLTGTEIYQQIRQINSDMPICFMTGFASHSEIEKIVRIDSLAEVIHKPFQGKELLQVVKKLISSSKDAV